MSAIAPTAPLPRGPLDRFPRLFAEVHDGESGQVLLLAFNADYFRVVNIAGMLLQVFVVSRLVKRLGVRALVTLWLAVEFLLGREFRRS